MTDVPEFSHLLKLDTLASAPTRVSIKASELERTALARRFGLLAIHAFSVVADVSRDGQTILIKGQIDARIEAPCVATGEAVPFHISEPVELRFLPPGQVAPDEEIEIDSTDCDIAEHDGRSVDIGEAAAQTLALAIPPYPRSKEADSVLEKAGVTRDGDDAGIGSLGRLLGAQLKGKTKGDNG